MNFISIKCNVSHTSAQSIVCMTESHDFRMQNILRLYSPDALPESAETAKMARLKSPMDSELSSGAGNEIILHHIGS